MNPSHSYRLLLIEDDSFDRDAFLRYVATEELRYKCETAASVAAAREILEQVSFDVILSDYNLGDGTAFDLLDRAGEAPVILVAGAGDEEVALRAMKAGIFDYLAKDVERNYLKFVPLAIERAMRIKRNEEELREARDVAEAANRAKSVFLSRMSHELRTPLNAIVGAAEMLELDTDRKDEYIRLLKQGSSNLLSIVNDILELSAVESGRMILSETNFSPAELVRETVAPLEIIAERKQIKISTTISPNVPPLIRADESKLRQVLLNLLGNAVKFTEQGGISISVVRREYAALLIEVVDSGPGIPENEQRDIFEPYRRVSTMSRKEGSGLGLAITRSLLELMGGGVSVTSTVGRGSRFSVQLPFLEASEGAQETAADGTVDLSDRRLLLVEDNDVNVFLIERMLQKMNATGIDVARNGQEAVELSAARPYDLILMDKQMPVMDGLEATRRIREREQRTGQGSRIIAITADAFEEDRQLCLAAGCDDCVSKPLSIKTLAPILGRLLKV